MTPRLRLRAVAAILTLSVVGCASPDSQVPAIVGAWDLEALSVDSRTVPMTAALAASQIEFAADGRIRGRAPCNDFSGSWSFDDRLVLGEATSSAVDCVDPDGGDSIMDAERVLLAALFEEGSFDVVREDALLQLRSDDVVVGWRRSAP